MKQLPPEVWFKHKNCEMVVVRNPLNGNKSELYCKKHSQFITELSRDKAKKLQSTKVK